MLSPLLLLIALSIKLTSPGPVLFCQERVGREFHNFLIYKFRTMVPDAEKMGGQLTAGRDPRITTVGHFLRKTKLDEFPQLLNVLKGEMSFVGPRPEVPKYVEMFRDDYSELLKVRPGITDLASLEYRHESELLGKATDPESLYVQEILPEKNSTRTRVSAAAFDETRPVPDGADSIANGSLTETTAPYAVCNSSHV